MSRMSENQGCFGVKSEGDLVSQMRGLPPTSDDLKSWIWSSRLHLHCGCLVRTLVSNMGTIDWCQYSGHMHDLDKNMPNLIRTQKVTRGL